MWKLLIPHKYPQIINAHMTISEKNGEMNFLYTLVHGAANQSYGVQVAKLAGLPLKVTTRAKTLLTKLEFFQSSGTQMSLIDADVMDICDEPSVELDDQTQVKLKKMEEWKSEVANIKIGELTPLDALNRLASLKEKILL